MLLQTTKKAEIARDKFLKSTLADYLGISGFDAQKLDLSLAKLILCLFLQYLFLFLTPSTKVVIKFPLFQIFDI